MKRKKQIENGKLNGLKGRKKREAKRGKEPYSERHKDTNTHNAHKNTRNIHMCEQKSAKFCVNIQE